MPFQLIFNSKGAFTHITFKRFFARVYRRMDSQRGSSPKVLRALRTLKRKLGVMRAIVHKQGRFLFESFSTDGAHERSLIGVDPLMVFHVTFAAELATANVAVVVFDLFVCFF